MALLSTTINLLFSTDPRRRPVELGHTQNAVLPHKVLPVYPKHRVFFKISPHLLRDVSETSGISEQDQDFFKIVRATLRAGGAGRGDVGTRRRSFNGLGGQCPSGGYSERSMLRTRSPPEKGSRPNKNVAVDGEPDSGGEAQKIPEEVGSYVRRLSLC